MYPRVKTVKSEENFKLKITFNNGKVGIFDVHPYLNFGIFSELKNIAYFKKVKPFYGAISWPHGQDICPDTLYQEAILTNQPSGRKLRKRRASHR